MSIFATCSMGITIYFNPFLCPKLGWLINCVAKQVYDLLVLLLMFHLFVLALPIYMPFFAIFFKSALVNISAYLFPTKPPVVYDVFWIALFESAKSASVTDSQNLLLRLLSKLFLKDKNHNHWRKYNLWVQSSIWFYMYTSINNQSYFFYFIYSVFYY